MTRTPGIVAVAVAVLAAGCGEPAPRGAAPPGEPITVTAAPVRSATVSDRLEAGGVVAASASAVVSSRVLAPILRVTVRAGDRVRGGDVLVTLDGRDAAARSRQANAAAAGAEQALAQARSDHAAAAAEQKLAVASHTRIASLRERNSATDQELDEAAARLATAAARAAGAQARIDHAIASLDASRAAADAAAAIETYTVIRAPFDGDITERLADPGNLAAPGTPLLRIDAGGAHRVDVRVDEARIVYLRPGDRVEVFLDGLDRDGNGGGLEGTVVEIARAVAVDQRAFAVKVALPSMGAVRTGTFARVRFRGAARQALLVPPGAIRRQGQVTSVFVVQDGVARLRLIQIGARLPEGVEVRAGLDAGEAVVTSPAPALGDGHAVAVTTEEGNAGAAP